MTLAIPTVHLNGTAKRDLLDGYCKARIAVIDAIAAVQHGAPNARDYYPQGNTAFALAREQHVARLRQLQTVVDELEKIALAVDEA